MSKLKIAPLAADLGTQQQPRTIRLGEPRGIAIPLQEREPFVEDACFDGQVTPEGLINGFRFFEGAPD